jgi:hypothetical protein
LVSGEALGGIDRAGTRIVQNINFSSICRRIRRASDGQDVDRAACIAALRRTAGLSK